MDDSEQMSQMNRKQIIKIKFIGLAIFALSGCFQGIFFSESAFVIIDMIKEGDNSLAPFWIVFSISVYFLIVYTIMYMLGMKYSANRLLPFLQTGNLSEKLIPYIDFSWIWLAAHSSLLMMGLCNLVRMAIIGSADLKLHFIIMVVLILYNFFLNYFICPRFCTEDQKKYFLGPFINSQINSLFRRLPGSRGKKSVH